MIKKQCFLPSGLTASEGKTWQSQRKFTIKHLRELGFKKEHAQDLVSNEVKELLSTFKEYHDNKAPLHVKDMFIVPVLNGLWTLVAGEKHPQKDTRLKNIVHEFLSLVYSFCFQFELNLDFIQLTHLHCFYQGCYVPSHNRGSLCSCIKTHRTVPFGMEPFRGSKQ